MNLFLKYVLSLSVFGLVLLFASCDSGSGTTPTQPIFPDTELITLTAPAHGAAIASLAFTYNIPPEVEYAIIGIFDSNGIRVSGSTLDVSNLIAGSSSGKAAFTRSSLAQSSLLVPLADKSAFSDTGYVFSGTGVLYYWAVWGYDKYGNLTHSSPAWNFTK